MKKMFVNKIKINISKLLSGTTETTVNIPITMTYDNVDNSELIEKEFVDFGVENSINTILDYEKVRFSPVNSNNDNMLTLIYDVFLFDSNKSYVNTYGDIGFTNEDINKRKNSFKNTLLDLRFYDTDNPLTQTLISFTTLFSELNSSDILPIGSVGQTKPANQISTNFVLENPLIRPKSYNEGFNIYGYKSQLKIGDSMYLYMRASFKNAKTGKSVNLMVQNSALSIDKLIHKLYTRYKLSRTSTGYHYEIDDTYNGDSSSNLNNITYSSDIVTIKLYEINAL